MSAERRANLKKKSECPALINTPFTHKSTYEMRTYVCKREIAKLKFLVTLSFLQGGIIVQNILLFDVEGADAMRHLLLNKHFSTQLAALAFHRVGACSFGPEPRFVYCEKQPWSINRKLNRKRGSPLP